MVTPWMLALDSSLEAMTPRSQVNLRHGFFITHLLFATTGNKFQVPTANRPLKKYANTFSEVQAEINRKC